MELRNFSEELQNYIKETEEVLAHKGHIDYDSCQRLLEYAAETKSDELFGLGYYRFAEYYWHKQDFEQTLHCLGECIKCFRNVNAHEYLARAYNLMGVASGSCGNRLVALSYLYIAMQYAQESGDSYVQAMIHSNTAYVLLRIKRYEDAKERCYRAISLFKQSENTLYRDRNMVWSMIRCGFCHLLLDESDNAIKLWDEIQEILQNHPGHKGPSLIFLTYGLGCEAIRGDKEYAAKIMNKLEFAFVQETNLQMVEDMIVPIAELLNKTECHEQLERLIQVLDEYEEKRKPDIYLDMFPYKSKFLLERGKIDEYIEYSKDYLETYHQSVRDNNIMTARILELQERLCRVEAEQQDMREYNQKLEEIALYDSLTNLPNRAYLNEYIAQKFEEASKQKTTYGIELLDIDSFKAYNDTYGHLQGDVCLEAVANVLHEVANENVFCARYGGDEFMIIYSGLNEEEIRDIAEEIQQKVRSLEIVQGETGVTTCVTVSQGVMVKVPDKGDREWDFNAMADALLYHAKQEGKNCYRIATEFH